MELPTRSGSEIDGIIGNRISRFRKKSIRIGEEGKKSEKNSEKGVERKGQIEKKPDMEEKERKNRGKEERFH